MPKEKSPGKATTRRYSAEEKAAAVRMVRTLRKKLGTDHGTIQRVANQLGYGVESVRSWVHPRYRIGTQALPETPTKHGVPKDQGT